MSMSSGLPWEGSPLANLSLSDPRCNNDSCRAFYNAHQLSQKEVSYYYQYKYGHFTTWYYLAFVGLFAIVYLHRKWQEHSYAAGRGVTESGIPVFQNKCIAAWRFVAYRRIPGWMSRGVGMPSMGMLFFLLLAVLYILILTFAVRPYYRQHRGYGSPPLAVRTGLMAVALTPLIIALAGKANIITLLTGVGHEKLNVIHRWVGWICFGLSVTHTVPFIVAPLRDGGYTALHKQFYKPGYTGVPPLAMLFGLLLFSLPWIRHRVYEGFYHLHFWLAVAYVGLMFWHAGDEGDSWVYLWATITAWLLSIFARAFWFMRTTNTVAAPWAVGSPLTATILPSEMTLLKLVAPQGFHWRPGQHVYLRIPQVAILDNHPFTIASAEAPVPAPREAKRNGEERHLPMLSLYVRSHAGFTRRLRQHLESRPQTQLEAWLDGPYGGHSQDLGVHFDEVLLVAGGSGISACLPYLEHFAWRMRTGQPRLRTRHVRLVWSIRDSSALTWVADALKDLDLPSLTGKVDVLIHITDRDGLVENNPNANGVELSELKDIESTSVVVTQGYAIKYSDLDGTTIRSGRIDMQTLFRDLGHGSRVMVIGCGPEGLKADLSNACAGGQLAVFQGHLAELALWTETFGW